jgi:hypothetical protein
MRPGFNLKKIKILAEYLNKENQKENKMEPSS